MVCGNCKKEVNNDINYCPYCGRHLHGKEKIDIQPVVDKVKDITKTMYKDPNVREIVDDVVNMVVESANDTKKRIFREVSKQTKKNTTKILIATGLKKKNILDHIKDSVKK